MRVLSTGEVAERLGVSPASVRRVLTAYERVSGEALPRDKRGEWLLPEGVMAHLEAAHVLVRERRLPWDVALGVALGKNASPTLARKEDPALLEEVLARIRALEEENRALRNLLEEQREVLKRLVRALEEGEDKGAKKRPRWRFWA